MVHIAVGYAGDAEDITERSGTPFGVLHGVRSHGYSADALVARRARNVDRAVAATDAILHLIAERARGEQRDARATYKGAHLGRRVAASRSRAAMSHSRRKGFDLILALGSGYETPTDTPFVIYDDMTVAQAIRAEYPAWVHMRESDRQFRLEQQQERYARAVKCCMTTSWAAQSVLDDYEIPQDKIAVVGAGTHETPRSVNRDWRSPSFLFVGLDWKRKNGDRVLESFRALRKGHPTARLDIVGNHPPISQPGVYTHGRLLRSDETQRANLRSLFDHATCFVMPSLHEPGGIVFIEAAAAGVGAIGGDRGGSADFVGDAGIVLDPFDDRAIAQAMERFCEPGVARQFGEKAAARVGLFSWAQVAGRLLVSAGVDVPGVEQLPWRDESSS